MSKGFKVEIDDLTYDEFIEKKKIADEKILDRIMLGNHEVLYMENGMGFVPRENTEKVCYICKEIKENGQFFHYGGRGEYTDIYIEPGKEGRFRCFAYGEGVASIICNYCPSCGRQLNNPIMKGEK